MFFRKKQELQRQDKLGLKPEHAPLSDASHSPIDPARLEAVNHRAKGILEAGRIPEWLFVCGVPDDLLVFQPPGQKPVMLIFSSPFASGDYLRATGTAGKVRQFKVEKLSEMAKSWLSFGLQGAVLDRCPRCPQFLSIDLAGMAKWTSADFAKAWAHLRAVRWVLSETRIRAAMNHLTAGSHAAARSELEYVRDHFDCGVPYLHQMIGLLAGMECDEVAKSNAMERLKEFGPGFEGPLDFSTERLVSATVGMMASFGIAVRATGSK